MGIEKRGFASMDKELHREIASQGGVAAHKAGTAHEFTTEEAKKAGRKGGKANAERLRAKKSTISRSDDGKAEVSSG